MNLKKITSNQLFRSMGILVIGITIGAIFYPTKHIEEKITQKYEQEISSLKETHSKEVKEITEKYALVIKENKELQIKSDQKISKLTSEVKTLQKKQKITTYKLIKPDGTIEERTFTESELNKTSDVVIKIQEEFKVKISEIETKWSEIHKERTATLKKEFDSRESSYKRTIEELQKSKTISVNEKHFGLEVGVMNNNDYYSHITSDVWGPIFIGIQGEFTSTNTNSKLGAGIGLRF